MSIIKSLVSYDNDNSSSSDNDDDSNDESMLHLKQIDKPSTSTALIAAPAVVTKEDVKIGGYINLKEDKVVKFNPNYEQLYSSKLGPTHPTKTNQQKAHKNTLTGFVEPSHLNVFQFETQRRTFESYGYAIDPSVDNNPKDDEIIGDKAKEIETKGFSVFETMPKREKDKRKREVNRDSTDVDGYLGPWAKYKDEATTLKPSEDEQKILDELVAKRPKRKNHNEHKDDKPIEEKTTLHISDSVDYQGRTFLHPPQDTGVNLKATPAKCFLPKKLIHTWTGHTKALSCIRWFPKTAHLLLSSSMDSKIKIWEVYNDRRCIRTYSGHKQAVRDVSFNNKGDQFISASYDRFCKLWDTETGQCISRFTSKKVPYCVKFNPEPNKQHLFVAGMSNRKIVCFDTRSGDIVQEYDRHLGAVNTITFIDQDRRFVSTSDDKSLRCWEWDIPVDFKYIADTTLNSMPSTTLSPNGKWLACQSMDNTICMFNALANMKYMKKKVFKGHMVAGYACSIDYSPDMNYLISGDADGKLYFWDFKTTKLYTKFKAHDDVLISCLWHPHETSKVATASWDGVIKYWD